MNRLPVIVFSAFTYFLNGLTAVSFANDDEDTFFDDLPVVLSANRIPNSYLESASSISIITKEMIESIQAKNIPDILAMVPGFQTVYATGNIPVTTYHGLGNRYQRRFQVLIDNRSVYTPYYGGVSWQDLPISVNDIEKIEIIRGPNAAVFGSNSFSAVISITTKHSQDEQGSSLNLLTGDNNWAQQYLRYAKHLENSSYSFSLQADKDSGLNNLQDSSNARQANFRLDSQLSSSLTLNFQLGFKQVNKEAGTTTGTDNSRPVRDIPVSNYFVQLNLENKPNEDELFRIQFYRNVYTKDDRYTFDYPVPNTTQAVPVSVNEDAEVIRNDVELLYNYNKLSTFKFLFGLGLRNDSIIAEGLFNTNTAQTNEVIRLFSQLEWQASDALLLKAGFMNEQNKIAGFQQIPKVSAVYLLGNQSSFRFNYSVATRAPVLVEHGADRKYSTTVPNVGTLTYTAFVGNNNLLPEKITATELGFLHYFSATNTLDIKLFNEQLTDIITQQYDVISQPNDSIGDGLADTFSNQDKVTINGIEVQWDNQISSYDQLLLQYTYLETSQFNNTNNDNSRVPKNSYSALWRKQLSTNHSVNLRYIYYDKFEWLDSKTQTDINNIDVSYQYKFYYLNGNATLSVGAKNLLNSDTYYQSKDNADLAKSNPLFYINFKSNFL